MTRLAHVITVFAAALAPLAAFASETALAAGQPADPCLSVAAAKSSQWAAKRMMVRETQTFADGTSRRVEAIFTDNGAYAHIVGQPWKTSNLLRGQRGVTSAEKLVKSMDLTNCELVGPAMDEKQHVLVYTYDYAPDANASQVTGRIWISDSTSRPVRQELKQETEAAHGNVPVAISARFLYGDAVQVPSDATRADETRRFLNQEPLLLQRGVGGIGLGVPPMERGAGTGHH